MAASVSDEVRRSDTSSKGKVLVTVKNQVNTILLSEPELAAGIERYAKATARVRRSLMRDHRYHVVMRQNESTLSGPFVRPVHFFCCFEVDLLRYASKPREDILMLLKRR